MLSLRSCLGLRLPFRGANTSARGVRAPARVRAALIITSLAALLALCIGIWIVLDKLAELADLSAARESGAQ